MPSVFPISGGPISGGPSGGGGGPTPPPVAITAVQLPESSVKYRWKEPYVSEATNTKFLGVPRGVYVGFIPSFNGQVLELAPDSDYGVSLLRVNSLTSLTSIDICSDQTIQLDFTDHVIYPVFVIGRVSSNVGGPVVGEIVTSITAPTTPSEVLICRVDGPGIFQADAPLNRDEPYAYATAPLGYGFMKDGAVEELIAAVNAVAEVQTARTDLTGTTQVDLTTRLNVDGQAAAVADRLARNLRVIRLLDQTLVAPAAEMVVSSSFSSIYRTSPPIENIDGFGSETLTGAVTDGLVPSGAPAGSLSDAVRNTCVLVDPTTGARIMNGTNTVFGRLSLGEIVLQGSVSFTVGLPTVTGFATVFASEVEPGDLICDTTGNCYEVLSVADNFNLTLSSNALLTDTTMSKRKRFVISFFENDGIGNELPVALPGATDIRAYVQMWRTYQGSLFDQTPFLFANGEQSPVPIATTTTAGRARLAAIGSLAGALRTIRDTGVQVGTGNINTINFLGCTNAGGGVLDVTQAGPAGPQGSPAPSGPVGPTGPAGATGPGLTSWTYHPSGDYIHSVLGPSFAYEFNVTTAYSILFLTGGLRSWYQDAPTTDSDDYFNIQSIRRLSATSARLVGRVPAGFVPHGVFSYYLITAGQ